MFIQRFVNIFIGFAKQYFPDREIYCSVGIAYGEATGYFPSIGLKRYDLYGDCLVKATRYEAFRKELYKRGISPTNLIIVQDNVYQGFLDKMKEELKPFTLNQTQVRNDPMAKVVYYKTIDAESQPGQNQTSA